MAKMFFDGKGWNRKLRVLILLLFLSGAAYQVVQINLISHLKSLYGTILVKYKTRKLLDREIGNWGSLRELGALELSKRLNFFVYNYCSSKPPYTGTADPALLDSCRTMCGGYVWVFRTLVGEFGFKTRHVGLYGVPMQGNHSMAEVEYAPGKWALFDPTFGSFFTSHGTVGEDPLSLDELNFRKDKKSVAGQVISARRLSPKGTLSELSSLYLERTFEQEYFRPEFYVSAESYGPDDPAVSLLLRLNLNISNGVTQFGSRDPHGDVAEKQFLEATNQTLLDSDPHNDVSFNFSHLDPPSHLADRLFFLRGLVPGRKYIFSIMGVGDGSKFYFQTVDGGVKFKNTGPFALDGSYRVAREFLARATSASLIMHTYWSRRSGLCRLFKIQVEAAADQAD